MRRNVRLTGVAAASAVTMAGALLLGACGTDGTRSAGPVPPGAVSALGGEECGGGGGGPGDRTSDDQGAGPDRTSDDQGAGPDLTSDDQGEQPDLTSDDQDALPDETSDDQGALPDETSDDQGALPDGTSDDQGVLPDETSDDQGESPDATSDDQGGPCAAAPTAGPERWFPMRGAFLDFLASNATGDDDAIASHVTEVRVRKAGGRGFAEVRVTYGADEAVEARRVARAFAQWRHTGYGDAGRVRVLGPGWAGVERDW